MRRRNFLIILVTIILIINTFGGFVFAGNTANENYPKATVGDFIERLYTVALGRASEKEGKTWWVNEITTGNKTGADCGRFFLISEEFNNRGLTIENFVETLYATFFDRASEVNGKNYWVNELKTNKKTRVDVINGFIDSTEWCNICATYGVRSGAPTAKAEIASQNAIDFATRLYTCCLNREPENGGLNYWSLALTNLEQTGATGAQLFFESQEFVNFRLNDKEYLTRLYTTFMGREPDEGGMNYWLSELTTKSRREVMSLFVQSPEFKNICATYGIECGEVDFNRGIPTPETPIVTPEPTKPVKPTPTKPVEPTPTKPVTPRPTTPVEPTPTKPIQPEPTKPVTPKPTEPTKPVEPTPTKPVEPKPTTPVEPTPTEPVKPEPTKPVTPKPTEPTKPVTPKPTQPVTPVPTKPVTPKPTTPVTPTPVERNFGYVEAASIDIPKYYGRYEGANEEYYEGDTVTIKFVDNYGGGLDKNIHWVDIIDANTGETLTKLDKKCNPITFTMKAEYCEGIIVRAEFPAEQEVPTTPTPTPVTPTPKPTPVKEYFEVKCRSLVPKLFNVSGFGTYKVGSTVTITIDETDDKADIFHQNRYVSVTARDESGNVISTSTTTSITFTMPNKDIIIEYTLNNCNRFSAEVVVIGGFLCYDGIERTFEEYYHTMDGTENGTPICGTMGIDYWKLDNGWSDYGNNLYDKLFEQYNAFAGNYETSFVRELDRWYDPAYTNNGITIV